MLMSTSKRVEEPGKIEDKKKDLKQRFRRKLVKFIRYVDTVKIFGCPTVLYKLEESRTLKNTTTQCLQC